MHEITSLFDQLLHWLVAFVEHFGVGGIFVMTFLESTFVPLPSEMTMIPAGYLVHEGRMPLLPTFLASVVGTLAGSYFNYWLAQHMGRRLFLRYGKYFLMDAAKLAALEGFFHRHGSISIFTGRLIPGVRHCISFPAGLARMDLRKFVLYTTTGGALWMGTLMFIGYHLGANQALVMAYMPTIKLAVLGVVGVLILAYVVMQARQKRIQ